MKKGFWIAPLLVALVAAAFLFRSVLTGREVPAPAASPAPAAEAPATPEPVPTATETPAPEAATPALSDGPPQQAALPPVPEIHFGDHPIHEVPVEPLPPPKSGDAGQGGRTGQSDEVALGPRSLQLPTAPRQFNGSAKPTGGVGLEVGTTNVELFGVKTPGAGYRCGADSDADCKLAAQHALEKQIGNAGKVSCHVPNAKPGLAVAFAICLDGNGVDLGGFLIGAGLAVADTGQSYDYVGAESIARNLKRGLWQPK